MYLRSMLYNDLRAVVATTLLPSVETASVETAASVVVVFIFTAAVLTQERIPTGSLGVVSSSAYHISRRRVDSNVIGSSSSSNTVCQLGVLQ